MPSLTASPMVIERRYNAASVGPLSGHAGSRSALPQVRFGSVPAVLRARVQIQSAVWPPSTKTQVPVMKDASSEARKRIALATSTRTWYLATAAADRRPRHFQHRHHLSLRQFPRTANTIGLTSICTRLAGPDPQAREILSEATMSHVGGKADVPAAWS